MKKAKKSLSLLLVALMTVAAASSCGKEGKPSSTVTSSQPSSTGATESSGTGSSTLIAEPLTIQYLFPENGYAPISQDCVALQEIARVTNVTLDFQLVPAADYDTKKSTYLATNKMPDVFSGGRGDIKTYAGSGMFLNLSDYEQYMPDYLKLINSEDRAADSKYLYYNGGMYSFVRLEQYRVGTAPQPMIRMDLLEKNNIPVPTTWDELYDVFLKLKELYPEAYIMATRNGTNYMIGQIAYALGSGGFEGFGTGEAMYYEPTQDKYLFGPIHDNFKTVLTFLHNMYEDNLLDPDYAVMTRDICWEKLSSGKLLFFYDNDTFAARTFNPALREVDPDARFDLLDPMENSYGQTRALRYQRDWFADNTIISADVKRPEDIVTFFNWLYTDEGAMISNFGVEGKTYTIVDGEPKVTQELLDKYSTASDVLSAIQADIGVGQFNFTPYINETWFKQTADSVMVEHGDRIDALTEAGKIQYMNQDLDLAFTEDEINELTNLKTNAITVFNSEIDKFITGTRSLDEFGTFVEELKAQGAERIEEMYNQAYDRIK